MGTEKTEFKYGILIYRIEHPREEPKLISMKQPGLFIQLLDLLF